MALFATVVSCSSSLYLEAWADTFSAIPHFHKYLELYIDMCTDSAFTRFHWVYPGNYQPLQAVAVLLADLADDSVSPEASISRVLIDRVFSLLGPAGSGVVAHHYGRPLQRRLSTSSQEVWTMLRRLRRRVWKEMKIDPTLTWSCECLSPYEDKAN
jgi:hypothetical protein